MVEQCLVKMQKSQVAALCEKVEYAEAKTILQMKLKDAQNQLNREQRRRHDAKQQIN